jgi:aryl-alcohol dehydrogenase-like predicted oxidoreductase
MARQGESSMKYTKFGNTGLQVSRLCLGCMTYGEAGSGTHEWTLDEAASRPMIRQAVEAGINFFDTANAYSGGTSEEITGRALRDFTSRDEIVVATKAFAPWRQAPNTGGLSRKALFQAVDDSLGRLGMDYIDLYQIHRWDYNTPIEETMEALHDLVKSGKVRYIGASSMFAWQFMKSIHLSKMNGWSTFVSMQNHYNLMYREEEREMNPLCEDQGIALMPWSPLARGKLTRDWDTETTRSESDEFGKILYAQTEESDRQVVEAVAAIAKARSVPRAQVAMAWLLSRPGVASPIIGATKDHHLPDAVAALDIVLTDDEVAALEAPYVPHPVLGMAGPMRIGGKVTLKG